MAALSAGAADLDHTSSDRSTHYPEVLVRQLRESKLKAGSIGPCTSEKSVLRGPSKYPPALGSTRM